MALKKKAVPRQWLTIFLAATSLIWVGAAVTIAPPLTTHGSRIFSSGSQNSETLYAVFWDCFT